MESGSIEITLHSAHDLHNPNRVSKPKPYAEVCISNDNIHSQKTPKDKDHLTNPIWEKAMKFNLDKPALQQGRLALKIVIYTKGTVETKEMGRVSIQLNELVKLAGGTTSAHFDSYPVRNPYGEEQGSIDISVKLGQDDAGQDDAPVVPPVQQPHRMMKSYGRRFMASAITATMGGLFREDIISDGGVDSGED